MKSSLKFLVIAVLAGCAAAPELDKYPRTQIDRPFTLPKKVASWTTRTYFAYTRDKTTESYFPPIPIPLYWNTSFSDDWNLMWAGIPLGVQHQIHRDADNVIGAEGVLGFGYTSDSTKGAVLNTKLSGYLRHKFSPKFAVEFRPIFDPVFYSKGEGFRWKIGAEVGPFVQVTDYFALRAYAEPSLQKGVGPYFPGPTDTLPDMTVTQFIVPIGAGFRWSLARQWDLDAEYSYYGIGYSNDYVSHAALVELVHFW